MLLTQPIVDAVSLELTADTVSKASNVVPAKHNITISVRVNPFFPIFIFCSLAPHSTMYLFLRRGVMILYNFIPHPGKIVNKKKSGCMKGQGHQPERPSLFRYSFAGAKEGLS